MGFASLGRLGLLRGCLFRFGRTATAGLFRFYLFLGPRLGGRGFFGFCRAAPFGLGLLRLRHGLFPFLLAVLGDGNRLGFRLLGDVRRSILFRRGTHRGKVDHLCGRSGAAAHIRDFGLLHFWGLSWHFRRSLFLRGMPNLFGDAEFRFEDSKGNIGIQLADLISGTLSYVFDRHKRAHDTPDYLEILKKKTIRIEMYPKTYATYVLENSAIAKDYDEEIAKLCFAQAVKFIERNADEYDPEIKAQVIVLQYLLFRFMNNDTRGYIYTQELKAQLANTELRGIKDQTFRMRIIGRLRDKGVIIASSQRGYKIPSKQAELYDFINHDAKIVIPMLARLKRCRDLVKLGTANKLDLLAHPQYSQLQAFFDSLPVETDFEQ